MRLLAVKNIGIEGPGLFGDFFENAGWDIDEIDLQAGVTCPRSSVQYDAVMILGGPMSVHETENYPFLADEITLIQDCLGSGVKLLGLCLGAQLIAKALGSRVINNSVKEIGWSAIKLTDEGKSSQMFQDFPEIFHVFQWHGDTFELPEGALHLAKSNVCENQAFSYGNALALQFHMEVKADDVGAWCDSYQDELISELGQDAKEKIVQDTIKIIPETKILCKRLFESFINI